LGVPAWIAPAGRRYPHDDRPACAHPVYDGRIRTVEPAPGGGLWMTTTNGDKDSTANNSNTEFSALSLG
jgi:hypothetical protein